MTQTIFDNHMDVSAKCLNPIANWFHHIFNTPIDSPLPQALQTVLDETEVQEHRAFISEQIEQFLNHVLHLEENELYPELIQTIFDKIRIQHNRAYITPE